MVQNIYRKLTKEQLARGVVFASTLSPSRSDDIHGLHTKEITMARYRDGNGAEIEKRLRDTKFFNGTGFKFNIIRTR